MRKVSGKVNSENQNKHFMFNINKVSKEYVHMIHLGIWYSSKTNLYPVTEKRSVQLFEQTA